MIPAGLEKQSGQPENIARLILVLLLALSAAIQLTVASRTSVDIPLRADARDYFSYAYNLHAHGVYSRMDTWAKGTQYPEPVPDNIRAPGYPVFLSLLGTPRPDDTFLRRVTFVQAGMGVLALWLFYLVAAGFLGRRWALVPTLFAAISPHLATINTYLLTESLFFLVLMASVLASQKAVSTQRRTVFLLAGACWALCSLVRPTVQFLPFFLLVGALLIPAWRKFRKGAILATASFLVLMSPWAIRNMNPSVDRPASSLMVKTILHGSYPDFMYKGQPGSFGFPYRFDPASEARSRDLATVLRHVGAEFREQPLEMTRWYLLGKPLSFLSWAEVQGFDILIYPVSHTPYYEDVRFAALRLASWYLHWPLMVLGLAGGLMLCLRRGRLKLDDASAHSACLVGLVVSYAIFAHVAAAPFPRYGIPFRPLLFALAMLPVRSAWLAGRDRSRGGAK